MPTRIYVEVGVDMRNLSAARRLGVGERRERRDEDGRRGGGRAVRAVALVVVVARVVVAAAGRVVVGAARETRTLRSFSRATRRREVEVTLVSTEVEPGATSHLDLRHSAWCCRRAAHS